MVSTECMSLLHLCKVENSVGQILSRGLAAQTLNAFSEAHVAYDKIGVCLPDSGFAGSLRNSIGRRMCGISWKVKAEKKYILPSLLEASQKLKLTSPKNMRTTAPKGWQVLRVLCLHQSGQSPP